MRSAVPAFTVIEAPLELEPVTADPFIDTLLSSSSENYPLVQRAPAVSVAHDGHERGAQPPDA